VFHGPHSVSETVVSRATKLKANQLLLSACGCGKKLKTECFRYFRLQNTRRSASPEGRPRARAREYTPSLTRERDSFLDSAARLGTTSLRRCSACPAAARCALAVFASDGLRNWALSFNSVEDLHEMAAGRLLGLFSLWVLVDGLGESPAESQPTALSERPRAPAQLQSAESESRNQCGGLRSEGLRRRRLCDHRNCKERGEVRSCPRARASRLPARA